MKVTISLELPTEVFNALTLMVRAGHLPLAVVISNAIQEGVAYLDEGGNGLSAQAGGS